MDPDVIFVSTDGPDVSSHVRILSAATGAPLHTIKTGAVHRHCISLVGVDYILTADGSVMHVCGTRSRNSRQMKMIAPGKVSALAVSPDGRYCAGAVAELIHIWHVNNGNLLASVKRHYQPVAVIRWTDDSSHFISGGDDSIVVVWDLVTSVQTTTKLAEKTRHVWSNHSLAVTDVAVGCGGVQSRVATVSLDHSCKIYILASGVCLASIVFDSPLYSVCLALSEATLFCGAANGKIYRVRTAESASRREQHMGDCATDVVEAHSKAVTCLALDSTERRLVSGAEDGDVKIIDSGSRQILHTVSVKARITNIVLTPNYDLLQDDSSKPRLHIESFKRAKFDSSKQDLVINLTI